MNRRQFIRYSTVYGGIFIASLAYPQRSDAFLPLFGLLLRGGIGNLAMGFLVRGAFGLAGHVWQRRTQEWYDNRLDAMLAQSKFIANSFTDVTAAEVYSPQYTFVLAGQRLEQYGQNVAFSFPQTRNSETTIASFAGPGSLGMAVAAKYLKENQRLTLEKVQHAILPRYQEYNDFTSWSQPTSYVNYSNTASQDGVLIEYRVVKVGKGGYGIIDVTVNAHRRIDIPSIKVNYA